MHVHNNLYLISQPFEVSLIEHMPWLMAKNRENSLVSILIAHDVFKILKNMFRSEQKVDKSHVDIFDTFYNYKHDGDISQHPTLPLEVKFEPKNFYFVNGRLKYCPNLISPAHNVIELPDKPSAYENKKSSLFKTENINFLYNLLMQFGQGFHLE